MDRKVGSGRPEIVSCLSSEKIRVILRHDPKISAPKIAKILQEENLFVGSVQTIRNHLKKSGLFSFSIAKKPKLSKLQKVKRLEFCYKYSTKPETFWKNVIFSDECKFNLKCSDGRIKVWRNKGTRLNKKNIKETVKFGGGNVMVWGCVSSSGVGNIAFIEDTMDRFQYINIISNNLKQSANNLGLKDFIFQQDNDPKHTSKHAKQFIKENIALLL